MNVLVFIQDSLLLDVLWTFGDQYLCRNMEIVSSNKKRWWFGSYQVAAIKS